MKIFSFPKLRISGASFDLLQRFNFKRTRSSLNKLETLEKSLTALITLLSDDLHRLNVMITDGKKQQIIQNVRRDIYNNRNLSPRGLELISELLTPGLNRSLGKYIRLRRIKEAALQDCQRIYNEEMISNRVIIRKMIGSPGYLEGLLLSSYELPGRIREYLAKDPNHPDKKDLSLELTLLKYYSRMATKTTPFGAFTKIVVAGLEENNEWLKTPEIQSRKSVITLDPAIFKIIKDLLYSSRHLVHILCLRLNNSIVLRENQYRFLKGEDGVEVFCQLEKVPLLDFVFEMLLKATRIGYSEFIHQCLSGIDASEEAVIRMTDKLIETGFLEYQIPVSDSASDWDNELLKYLKRKTYRSIQGVNEILEALVKLQALKKIYSVSRADKRALLLSEMKDAVTIMHDSVAMHISASKIPEQQSQTLNRYLHSARQTLQRLWPYKLINEITADRGNYAIGKHQTSLIAANLQQLLHHLNFFAVNHFRGCYLTRFFKENYASGEYVCLIDFYERYSKIHGQQPITSVRDTGLEETKAIWIKRFCERFANVAAREDEVHIDDALLDHANECLDVNSEESTIRFSVTGMLQFFYRDGKLKCVLNSQGTGYGKLYSRFLHAFDKEVTTKLKEHNSAASGPAIFIENTESSFNSLNIRPALLADTGNIRLAEVYVCLDEKTGKMKLMRKDTHQQIFVVNNNLLAEELRSNFFQFLNAFAPAEPNTSFEVLNAALDESIRSQRQNGSLNTGILILPRVIYHNNIIVRRKAWVIPKPALPLEDIRETDWQYFSKVKKWQEQNNIPVYAFFRVDRGHKDRKRKDDYKPQFMDFSNPFFVRIFRKAIQNVSTDLLIEETLPHPSDMIKRSGKLHAYELAIQWHQNG
jgi:hypothetical protein